MTAGPGCRRFATSRRRLLRGAIAGAGVGPARRLRCVVRTAQASSMCWALAEPLSQRVQRALTGDRLAAEFPQSMISPVFRPNGSTNPQTPEYLALKADGFRGYRLQVAGLVERPLEFSLDALRALPTRTQVTRHDCVEGWSVIGKWSGRAAGAPARPGAAEAGRAPRRVPLLRRHQPATARAITKASTCSTPTIRRPSSRTASTARRCRSPTARRCACGSSASSGTSSPSTCA